MDENGLLRENSEEKGHPQNLNGWFVTGISGGRVQVPSRHHELLTTQHLERLDHRFPRSRYRNSRSWFGGLGSCAARSLEARPSKYRAPCQSGAQSALALTGVRQSTTVILSRTSMASANRLDTPNFLKIFVR